MIVLLWYQFSFLWKGPKIKLKSGVFQCFRPCVWCQINLGCVSFGSTQTCDLPLFLRVKDVFQILRRVPLLLCFLSTEFVLSRVQSTEYRAQSAKCSDCSAAEPSQSIGGRTFCGWKDGNSRVSEHLPNVATRFQQQRWQPSLNSTDNERWKTFVEKSEQGPLGEMRQIKTDTWCNWPKESSEPKVGRRKVSQGGNWVKGVWMSLSEQSKGGGRIFAGTELGRIWRSGSLGICRWDPAWWDWCKKGTGGKSLDKSVYFSSFLAVKEDVFRVHINYFAFHSLDELRKQCWIWTRQKLG